jgi:hypothetical protein
VVPVIGTIETSPMRSRAEAAVERQRCRVRLARMFRGWWCILIAFASLMIGVGAASALTTVTVKRCGYAAKGFYGKDAIYPWHMSCARARTILAGAMNPHAKYINLTADGAATGDAGPVLIDGRWWVCGGRMGFYFCGYPYRPAYVSGAGGGTTWKGPFTEESDYNACSAGGSCGAQDVVYLPALRGIALATGRRTQDSPRTNPGVAARRPGSSRAGEPEPECRHACYGLKPNVRPQL